MMQDERPNAENLLKYNMVDTICISINTFPGIYVTTSFTVRVVTRLS